MIHFIADIFNGLVNLFDGIAFLLAPVLVSIFVLWIALTAILFTAQSLAHWWRSLRGG